MNKKADLSGRTLVELLLAVVMIFILAAGIIQLTTSTFPFTSTKEKKESAERNFEALGDLIENLEPGQEVDGFPIYLYSNKHVIVGFERDKSTVEGVCVQVTKTLKKWVPDTRGGGTYIDIDISGRDYWATKPPICAYEAINKEDPTDMIIGGCLCICDADLDGINRDGQEFYKLFEATECQCLTEKDFGREISFIGGTYDFEGEEETCNFGGLLAIPGRPTISTLYVKRIMGGDGSEGEYVKLCESECENQVYDEYMKQ